MPWNKGRKIGQKRALRRQDVRTIRERLRAEDRKRDLALFNLAIDSKLPACDLVAIRVKDVYNKNRVRDRASVVLQRSDRPVQFEITPETKEAITDWLSRLRPVPIYLFPSRFHSRLHMSTRQYARLVDDWVKGAGLDPAVYGTHSIRRAKILLIVQETGDLKAAQLLLGHVKLASTARYLETELSPRRSAGQRLAAALKISEKMKL